MTAHIRHIVEFLGERRPGTGAEHARSARNCLMEDLALELRRSWSPLSSWRLVDRYAFRPTRFSRLPRTSLLPQAGAGPRRRPHPSSDGTSPSFLDDRIVEVLERSPLNDEADRLDETSTPSEGPWSLNT